MMRPLHYYDRSLKYHADNEIVYANAKKLYFEKGSFTMKEMQFATGIPMNSLCHRFADLEKSGMIYRIRNKNHHVMKRLNNIPVRVNIPSIMGGTRE